MKQFYVLGRVLICLTFIFSVFSCEKEEEFVLMEDDSVFPDKQFQVPNLKDVQINFKSKTSVDKLFHNSSSIKSPTGEDFKFSVDWDNSHEAVYDSDRQLNILYTPLKYESSKRVKSLIASIVVNDSLISKVITLAYLGEPSIESLSGILFVHNLDGDFESASAYKNGKLIKRAVSKTNKAANNKSTDGSCIEDRIAYLTVYGVEGYEEFFQGECIGGTTVVVNTSGGGIDTSTNGNTDFYIPSVDDGLSPSGGGGSSTSGGNDNNTPDAVISPDPFWPENVSPSSSVMLSLLSDLQLTLQEEQYLESLPENSLILYQIRAYLDQNHRSFEAQNFAKEAIGVLMDDGKVFWEEGIIITKDVKKCAPGIISKLIIDKTYLDLGDMDESVVEQLNLAGHILDIFNSSNKYNLIFDAAYLPLNSAGQKRNAMTTPERDPNNPYIINFRITLDKGLINNATDLAIARTIIHESLHAYLSYKYQDQPFSDLSSSLRKLLEASGFSSDKAQHNLMSQEFVNAISNSLANWDNNQINPNYYDYLSWSGAMLASPAYQSLSTDFQKNVFDANVAEGDAQNSFTSKAKGSVCQ